MFETFYGLTGKPFQLTPDPAFYFESVTHRKALSYLGYGLAQAEGFIVITGDVGAGKSTLVAHLMATIDHDRLTVGQVVTSNLDAEEVVHVVARSFGLEIEGHDKASALSAIEGFLQEEARAGRRCLLVVDESQNLQVDALEELRMLSNFQLGGQSLLQTLLLGQPEFRATLLSHPGLEQLRQRVIAAHHLEPMELAEVKAYIMHRLGLVGWQGNPSFDERVFAELYEATGGIPRRVNLVANRLLLLGAVEQRARIDAVMLHAVLSEMDGDNAFPEAAPKAMAKPERAPMPITPLRHPEPARPPEPVLDPEAEAELEAEREEREARIAQLEQEVARLLEMLADNEREDNAMAARISQLEAKLHEQEMTVRQTLTTLIEWIEGDETRRFAA